MVGVEEMLNIALKEEWWMRFISLCSLFVDIEWQVKRESHALTKAQEDEISRLSKESVECRILYEVNSPYTYLYKMK